MANSKIYLKVPFAQKDAAKALGAKWDASKKKWYAPSNIDITLFDQWKQNSSSLATGQINSSGSAKTTMGTITHAKDKNFIAYSDELPPWN